MGFARKTILWEGKNSRREKFPRVVKAFRRKIKGDCCCEIPFYKSQRNTNERVETRFESTFYKIRDSFSTRLQRINETKLAKEDLNENEK